MSERSVTPNLGCCLQEKVERSTKSENGVKYQIYECALLITNFQKPMIVSQLCQSRTRFDVPNIEDCSDVIPIRRNRVGLQASHR